MSTKKTKFDGSCARVSGTASQAAAELDVVAADDTCAVVEDEPLCSPEEDAPLLCSPEEGAPLLCALEEGAPLLCALDEGELPVVAPEEAEVPGELEAVLAVECADDDEALIGAEDDDGLASPEEGAPDETSDDVPKSEEAGVLAAWAPEDDAVNGSQVRVATLHAVPGCRQSRSASQA